MGGSITSLSYINENTIISKIACISFGGDKINENIAAKFGISYRDAKRIKERYGLDHDMTFKVPLVGNVTLDSLHLVIDESLQGVISRIKEKCDLEENKLSLKNIPVVVTGGSGKLYGIKELLKEKLAREVLIIPPYTFGARDQAYVNCLGLLRYADKYIIKMAGEELKASPLSRLKEENGNKNQTISSYDINEDL
jgi:cell division ATPase FtsA